ncbi:hypothetical protein [Flagellimonas sp.]|uniref:hypothetical protein n=1 Tax=Flagellimonas sp. TaxID=2058762 RepID=UPI003BAA8A0A
MKDKEKTSRLAGHPMAGVRKYDLEKLERGTTFVFINSESGFKMDYLGQNIASDEVFFSIDTKVLQDLKNTGNFILVRET